MLKGFAWGGEQCSLIAYLRGHGREQDFRPGNQVIEEDFSAAVHFFRFISAGKEDYVCLVLFEPAAFLKYTQKRI